ncbi:MAG: tRNA (adenosine(37)-N6)-threonylcarbamoyltransferase complex dimerization subunit type 1 TsaB, partial [Candidatus Cryptobacteroides sp.]
MPVIIYIETSTALCSTALSRDGKIIATRSSDERKHASLTAPFVKEMLDEQGLRVSDCDAVCVSMGPGSYTGLRVGVSTAKGLCFGAGIPMIGVGSLDTLVWQAIDGNLLPEGCRHIVPMIDARRMEVYSAVFDADGKQVRETAPVIVTEDSYADLLAEGPVLFIGDGAGKCAEVIRSANATFIDACPEAKSMLHLA